MGQFIIDSAKPDIILGNEFWLIGVLAINNSESYPESFETVRKDRVSDAHGGIFVAYKKLKEYNKHHAKSIFIFE